MRKYILDVALFLTTIAIVGGYYYQKGHQAPPNRVLGQEVELSTPTPTPRE